MDTYICVDNENDNCESLKMLVVKSSKIKNTSGTHSDRFLFHNLDRVSGNNLAFWSKGQAQIIFSVGSNRKEYLGSSLTGSHFFDKSGEVMIKNNRVENKELRKLFIFGESSLRRDTTVSYATSLKIRTQKIPRVTHVSGVSAQAEEVSLKL
jgi:hypothetical protein